jgi:acetyl esterase/lipase
MKGIIVLFPVLLIAPAAAQDVIPLWTGPPPFSKANSLHESTVQSWGAACAKNVTVPTLAVYPAQCVNSGHAIIILPGGGYELESIVAEGQEIAEYLSSRGIVAGVLKYRLPLPEASDLPHLLPLADARRAILLLKSSADKYGIPASKVGILGFSAGGHLAAAASVLTSKNADENPDFSALIYPVTTLGDSNRQWLEASLFHRPMTDPEKKQYALVDHVSSRTPPAFLVHAYDDTVVPIQESIAYAGAMKAAGRDVETHFFTRGGHGFGPGRQEDGTSQWMDLLANWINRQ